MMLLPIMMNERPVSITVVAWFYIAIGAIGAAVHAVAIKTQPLTLSEVGPLVVAIIAGAYMLRGRNWARWLALAWIAFHVAISVLHPFPGLIVHGVLLALIAYLLFHRAAQAYFRGGGTEVA